MEEQSDKPKPYENAVSPEGFFSIAKPIAYIVVGSLIASIISMESYHHKLDKTKAVLFEKKEQISVLEDKVDARENQVLALEVTKTLDLFPDHSVINNDAENGIINKFIKETSCGTEYLIPKNGPKSGKTTAEIDVYSGNRFYEGKCACDWQQIPGTSTTLTFHMPKKQAMQYLARRNIHPF